MSKEYGVYICHGEVDALGGFVGDILLDCGTADSIEQSIEMVRQFARSFSSPCQRMLVLAFDLDGTGLVEVSAPLQGKDFAHG